MRFFIDNCLSPKYAAILGGLDQGEVVALRDHFPQNTTDTTWIAEVGARGWVVVTVDRKQLSNAAERRAMKDAGVVAFFLAKSFSTMKFDDQVWRLVKHWPSIVAAARAAARSSCYSVSVNGKIGKIEPG